MPDGVYTAADLVNAYRRIDPGKISDISRILAALPGGANGSYTLDQLRSVGMGPNNTGLSGLSSRSMTAFQSALGLLGGGSFGSEDVQSEIGGIGGGNFQPYLDSAAANLGLSTSAFQDAIALAKERARLGKQYGGQIYGEGTDFIKESTPLRKAIIGSTERALGLPVSTGSESPVALFGPTAPERRTVEDQYQNARRALIEGTPTRGGQLNTGLNNLGIARANAVVDLQADATKRAEQFGANIGFEEPKLGLAAQESGANIATGNLGGASSNITAAGAGLTGVASGYNSLAGTTLQSQIAPAQIGLGLAGLNQQADLATMALLSQERLAGQSATAAKKGGTGAGAGAGLGSILAAIISRRGSS